MNIVPTRQRKRLPRWLYLSAWFLSASFFFTYANGVGATRASALSFSPIASRSDEVDTNQPRNFARTDQVQFDEYSLILRGRRIFLHSGEFHTYRLPVPSLWPDILQKLKAAGLNAVSVYMHMGSINPAPGVVDFGGIRALQPLFDAAKDAGIWVVLRPGPYINAETSAGGLSHWITAEVEGDLRSNASDYKAAWQDYIQGIIKATVPNQITSGGPVIVVQVDNEFSQSQSEHAGYFADLEEAYHNSAIDVPLTYNDPGMGSNFINGTGAVDLYGFDEYPQRSDCAHPTVWQPVPTNYYSYHQQVNPSQPMYIPEFQGGAFIGWGPTSPGFDACRVLTGPDFESVFYRQLWASNAKLLNWYMFYGGTSWGGLPFPGAFTSYDNGAAVTESRELTTKYDELKLQGIFLRSSPEFYKTDWIKDSLTGLNASSNPAAFVTLLQNPDTGAAFYIVRQNDSTSNATTDFKLSLSYPSGSLQFPVVAPSITLGGRESKVIVVEYTFGSKSKLLYSTAQVFFAGVIDGRDVLFLYGQTSQAHETALQLIGKKSALNTPTNSSVKLSTASDTVLNASENTTIITVQSGTTGLVTVWDSDQQLILFADSATATTFWSPVIAGHATDPLKNYWGVGTNTSVLVGGPYLIRNASITGTTLALLGDLKAEASLAIVAPKTVTRITWNGKTVTPNSSASASLTSRASGKFKGIPRYIRYGKDVILIGKYTTLPWVELGLSLFYENCIVWSPL